MITSKTAFTFTCHRSNSCKRQSRSHPWKCMYTRSPQDYWSNSVVFQILYVSPILLTTTKKRHAMSLTNAPYSCRPCEKRGWHCNLSDLAPYYPACFTDASLALLPYNMISKIVRHIFVKLLHGMCQSLEAIS